MGFKELPQRKWFLEACHMENDFCDVATKKMTSRGLPHSKTNVLQGLTTRKMLQRTLSHGKCFRKACHTENGLQRLTTPKMVYRGLPHGKWFIEA